MLLLGRFLRRPRVVTAALILGACPSAAAAAPLAAGCSQSGRTVTCTYTSGSNPFMAPAGVSWIHVVAVGGTGGEEGGHGSVVTADLRVRHGDLLYAVVGGDGASYLRWSETDLNSRLLVAAGGGGGGPSNLVPPGGFVSVDTTGMPMVQVSYRTRKHDTDIDHVRFDASAKDPEIVIHGRGFGHRPDADPRRGTSDLGRCGPIPGHTGSDYGDQLWIEDSTQHWSAGFTGYVDCIGLIIDRYSNHEIVYHLGSLYRLAYGQDDLLGGIYKLGRGDRVQINVNGTTFSTTVHYADSDRRSHRRR